MTLLTFIAAVAGNCKLWTEFANRIHAAPWKCRTLGRVRKLHDIGILLFPVLLLWTLSRSQWSFPNLLSQSFASWVVLAATAFGFLLLVIDAAKYQFVGNPRGTSQTKSSVTDLRPTATEHIAGTGATAFLAKLPWNDSLKFEVTEKRLETPGYPNSTKALRILHLTDWHFCGTPGKSYYDAVVAEIEQLDFDAIVFTGDLIDCVSLQDWIPSTLGRLQAPLGRYFILGNHDWFDDANRVRNAMAAAGWIDVGGKTTTFPHDDRTIVIAGNEKPWMGDAPDLLTETGDFRIALCHTPDLFGWARGQGVDLVLAGHNHGGQVVLPILGPVYSPSRYSIRYAAGLFRRGDSFMHVGRGLGGIHPIRFRCLPEVTVVELAGVSNNDAGTP